MENQQSSHDSDLWHKAQWLLSFGWSKPLSLALLLTAMWSLLPMGCQDRFCRNNYECAGYACDGSRVVCHSSCTTNEQCDTSRGYTCQEGACKCGSGSNSYCQRECFSDRDCERISGCLRITREGGKVKSEVTCTCQDTCQQANGLCLTRNNNNNANANNTNTASLTTPTGAPRQCVSNSTGADGVLGESVNSEALGEGEGVADGGADGGAEATLEGGTGSESSAEAEATAENAAESATSESTTEGSGSTERVGEQKD
ncbi:MAG: hypothetical protein EP343_00325 [Deltaproteobacteria bacterium]|nr:MAG: hypothetical protein EP343_00325 [Deltaproteobacteria bacterium]